MVWNSKGHQIVSGIFLVDRRPRRHILFRVEEQCVALLSDPNFDLASLATEAKDLFVHKFDKTNSKFDLVEEIPEPFSAACFVRERAF